MVASVVPSGPNEEKALTVLRARFPQAAAAELLRFARVRRHSVAAACEMYGAHLKWRRGPGASERLAEAARAVPAKFIRAAGVARDGSPLMILQGPRYDPSIGPEKHVLAIVQVLETLLPPDDLRKTTVLIDVRGADGWPNPPAHKILNFFRDFSSVLINHYPERVQVAVVYPMPGIVKHLWWMISRMADQATRDKFVVLEGTGEMGAPCPDKLGHYVALDQLPADAQARHQALARWPATPPGAAADQLCRRGAQAVPACLRPSAEERAGPLDTPAGPEGPDAPDKLSQYAALDAQAAPACQELPAEEHAGPLGAPAGCEDVDAPDRLSQYVALDAQAAPACRGLPAGECAGPAGAPAAGPEDRDGAESFRSLNSQHSTLELSDLDPTDGDPTGSDPVDQEQRFLAVDEPLPDTAQPSEAPRGQYCRCFARCLRPSTAYLKLLSDTQAAFR